VITDNMAEIQKLKEGRIKVRFDGDDWLAGIIPEYNASGTDYKFGPGFTLVDSVDPFRVPGYIMPGANPVDVTNAGDIDAVMKNGVVNGNKAYISTGGTEVHEYTISTATITNSGGVFPHAIVGGASTHSDHTTFVGEDVALYYLNGTKYLFYSYNDNTDGGVGRYDLSSTFDDDYVDAAATNGAVMDKDYPHPMIVGSDNILYVGDGKDLASLQGTTSAGIWNASALDLPNDYIITSFAKSSNYLVIYAYKGSGVSGSAFLRSEATAFFWDYVSDSFTYSVELPGNYVNGGFVLNGVPGCFVQGQAADSLSSRQSKILLVSSEGVQLLTDFNGNIPGHGGVEISGSSIMFNTNGDIYRFGSPYSNYEPSLNFITESDGSTGEGILKNFFNTQLVASSGTGASGGLNTLSSGFNTGFLFTAQKLLPNDSKNGWQIEYVRVQYRQTIAADGRGFLLQINGDNSNSSFDAHGLTTSVHDDGTNKVTIDKLVKIYSVDSSGNQFPRIDTSVGLLIRWGNESSADATNAAEVQSVEIFMTPLSIEEK